jgi:hypothetical protein
LQIDTSCACELIIGTGSEYFTGGFSTTLSYPLVIDGGSRVVLNAGRLISYYTGNNKLGNAIPSNIGASVGKLGDMAAGKSFYEYGFGQALGGATNDFGSFIYSGGSGFNLTNMMNNPNSFNSINYWTSHVGYTNGLFYDFYPLKKK